jgi:hypothetical protein
MTHKLVNFLAALVFTLFLVIGLLDWAGGCGESYTYADGSVHSGECIGRNLVKSTFRRLTK